MSAGRSGETAPHYSSFCADESAQGTWSQEIAPAAFASCMSSPRRA
jgi:hypothetical protein